MDKVEINLKNVDNHRLTDVFHSENFLIDEKKVELLLRFYELLTERNRVMNLTAITEFTQVVYKHFLDSLFGSRLMNLGQPLSVIDVGTGAGFPGIPLKICYPELQMTLMDSLNKRVSFLNEVIEELGLTGIRAVHGRAEDLGKAVEFRERFDYVVSRAVADLSVLSEYCLPFTKVGGRFLSYKGGDVEQEVDGGKKAVELLGGQIVGLEKFSYKIEDGESEEPLSSDRDDIYRRTIVVIEKIKPTGKKYPRKAGTPGKMPLGRS